MAHLLPPDALAVFGDTPLPAQEEHRGKVANGSRALRANEAIFLEWCREAACTAMPASPQTVARFIDALGETRAPATVRRYLSSVTALHRIAGWDNPVAAPLVQTALRRLHRLKGRAQAKVIPLTRPLIERMLAAAPASMIGLRNKALLGVAYDTLARPMEMAALRIEDVGPEAATVQIRPLSPDQPDQRQRVDLTPQTAHDLQAWQTLAPQSTGPLFLSLSHRSHTPEALNGLSITLIFKAMAAAAGVPATDIARISSHSTRVGATEDMARRGCSIPAIMQAGGWKIPTMVIRYIAHLRDEPAA